MKVFDQNVAKLSSIDEDNSSKESYINEPVNEEEVIEKVEMAYSLFLSHINKKSNEFVR